MLSFVVVNLQLNDADPEPLDALEQNFATGVSNTEDSQAVCDVDQVPISQLDPNILTALGENTEEAPKFGPKIHENLSCLWLPILRKGLKKETKDKLIQEYLIPENCALLQAPKLNPEISAAISEGTRTRDKRVESVQQQLGLGITALNKGLEMLLDEGKDKLQAIKCLSDSCRLLCDMHFVETEARKKFVTPGLDKSFLNIMQDVERDEMLFGNKLSEKIKATKVIEKQGLQIKRPLPNPKPAPFVPSQPSTSRSRPQGNWERPPRFPSNRGGRGGLKRTPPSGRTAPTNAFQAKPSAQSKQRATGHRH